MKWNDGRERALFEREQKQKRKEYLAAGMMEAQADEMRRYDEEWYRSRRREALHTQSLNVSAFDEDDEGQSPLLKKFLPCISREDKHFEFGRYDWVEEIADEALYRALKALSAEDLELLTEYVFDGFTQTEIARNAGVVKVVVCKKCARIKNFLKKFTKKG